MKKRNLNIGDLVLDKNNKPTEIVALGINEMATAHKLTIEPESDTYSNHKGIPLTDKVLSTLGYLQNEYKEWHRPSWSVYWIENNQIKTGDDIVLARVNFVHELQKAHEVLSRTDHAGNAIKDYLDTEAVLKLKF